MKTAFGRRTMMLTILVLGACGDDDGQQDNNQYLVCGNAVVEADEECDGTDLVGES